MKPGNLVPPAWAQLLVARFACGHEKTPKNSYAAGGYPRCKACHDARRRALLHGRPADQRTAAS